MARPANGHGGAKKMRKLPDKGDIALKIFLYINKANENYRDTRI